MKKNKTTRAAQMAASYAEKLNKFNPKKAKTTSHELADTTTPDMEDKLKKAKEKLRTFWEG